MKKSTLRRLSAVLLGAALCVLGGGCSNDSDSSSSGVKNCTVTVNFPDDTSGKLTYDSGTLLTESAFKTDISDLIPDGYAYIGAYTNWGLTTPVTWPLAINADVTVYVKTVKACTVTVQYTDGSSEKISIASGGTLKLSDLAIPSGYHYDGAYTDSTLSSSVSFPYPVTADAVVYVKVTQGAATYTLTICSGEETVGTKSYSSGTTLTSAALIAAASSFLSGSVCTGVYYDAALTEAVTSVTMNGDTTVYITSGAETGVPLTISTAAELVEFLSAVDSGNTYSGYQVYLTKDIDLSGNSIDTRVPDDGGAFYGTFDGKGHTVKNMTISDGDVSVPCAVGLFRWNFGTIQNLTVEGKISLIASGVVTDEDADEKKIQVGGVCGGNGGIISGCVSKVSITVTVPDDTPLVEKVRAGGICGDNWSNGAIGEVSGCTNSGAISIIAIGGTDDFEISAGGICGGHWDIPAILDGCENSGKISLTVNTNADGINAGGICGAKNAYVKNCVNSGAVTTACIGNANYHIGGICGADWGGDITDSRNTGDVTTSGSPTEDDCQVYVGGICGESGASVTDCSNTGAVSSTGQAGGICGNNWGDDTDIISCHNTGTVSGTERVGGICGANYKAAVSSCYNTGTVSGTNEVGGLLGKNDDSGTVSSCYSTGTVNGAGYDIGGICGANYEADISSCYNTGKVTGTDNVGGAIGKNEGTVGSCYNEGAVTGTNEVGGVIGGNYDNSAVSSCYNTGAVNGTDRVGGICGNSWGDISTCYNTGAVNGEGWEIGGVLGKNDDSGAVRSCYSTGTVNGSGCVGGICGANYEADISSCYNTGVVTGTYQVGGAIGKNEGTVSSCYNTEIVKGESYVGGVIGWNDGTTTDCYNTGIVSGTICVGGVAGGNNITVSSCYYLSDTAEDGIWNNNESGVAEALTAAKFADSDSFTGWDFNATWKTGCAADGTAVRPILKNNAETADTITALADIGSGSEDNE